MPLKELAEVQAEKGVQVGVRIAGQILAGQGGHLLVVFLLAVRVNGISAVVPPQVVGVAPGESYGVTDLVTGSSWTWGERNYVRLDPAVEPAHIVLVAKRT